MDTPLTALEQRAADLSYLTELQLQVARRADQLAAEVPARTGLNLACWLRAEQEILKQFWQMPGRAALSA